MPSLHRPPPPDQNKQWKKNTETETKAKQPNNQFVYLFSFLSGNLSLGQYCMHEIQCTGTKKRAAQSSARLREISYAGDKQTKMAEWLLSVYVGMAFSILYWSNYTAGTTKLSKKSQTAVQSDHVLKFIYDKDASFVRGIVQASMRDRSYHVTVSLIKITLSNAV